MRLRISRYEQQVFICKGLVIAVLSCVPRTLLSFSVSTWQKSMFWFFRSMPKFLAILLCRTMITMLYSVSG